MLTSDSRFSSLPYTFFSFPSSNRSKARSSHRTADNQLNGTLRCETFAALSEGKTITKHWASGRLLAKSSCRRGLRGFSTFIWLMFSTPASVAASIGHGASLATADAFVVMPTSLRNGRKCVHRGGQRIQTNNTKTALGFGAQFYVPSPRPKTLQSIQNLFLISSKPSKLDSHAAECHPSSTRFLFRLNDSRCVVSFVVSTET